ncbi:MAG TPA: Wzz/FepE/Etk N-terminal domain-containing protein [Steroidobacteraceae bacterium]|jgi:uncharacterized protein involved in exopolysaccharide biosynthesis|nr:Wzz/FepE/Etk N-terminal domain-containing protein [Steroidobacteraceae bacterium]
MNNEEGEISSQELFARLWRRRTWIVGSTIFSTAVAIAIAFWMTPIYRATTVLVPAGAERNKIGSLSSTLGQLGGLASLAGIGLGTNDIETEEALAVLHSREFTQRFIADNNLMPKLFSSKWNFSTNTWNVSEKKQPTPADAFKYLDRKVRHIQRDMKTGLVTLQIDWKDRDEAASWGNAMVERINSEMRKRAVTQADAYVGYLTQELARTTDIGTRDAINRLIESQIKQRMVATVTQEYAFRVIDRALAPDAKDRERPNKPLFAILGLLLGLTAGCFAALVVWPRRKPDASLSS